MDLFLSRYCFCSLNLQNKNNRMMVTKKIGEKKNRPMRIHLVLINCIYIYKTNSLFQIKCKGQTFINFSLCCYHRNGLDFVLTSVL